MKHFSRTLLVAGALATLAFQQARADVVVIVSAQSTVTRLTPGQIARIFQGKSNTMKPLDIRPPSSVRSEFYTKVVGPDARVRAEWSKLVFTGKGSSPREFAQAQLVTAIAADPNAIGYVDRSFVDMTVKVIFTVK